MTIEQEIAALKERNARVEADKAWETSMFRIGSIMCITYIVATVLLFMIGNDYAFRNALVPVVGYFLSTQSLSFLKRWWTARRK
ncbi:MAG: hypothetical protein NUV56_00945 [Candidatus Uhrbacteria bacterium]|nr:hypothetical protein [Candidatus Uhrbacteria bacterium]